MDFDKLKREDHAEWRAAQNGPLFGVGMGVARHWTATLHKHEIEDSINDAILVAMDKIASIPSETKLRAFVAGTVANKLKEKVESKAGPRSVERKSDQP